MQCRGEHHGHGGGGGGGGCGEPNHVHGPECDHDNEDPEGQSLYGFIDTSKLRALNESITGSCVNPFKPYSRRTELEPTLESNEDDPDLIIFVPFTRVVKLKSICIVGGHGGEGTSPAKIKLFVDRDDIDFSNCQDLPPAQEVELVEHNTNATIDYPLKLNKFQNVSTLTLSISENFGGDHTSISYIGFKGEATSARHGVVECVYESAPQVADHKTDAEALGQIADGGNIS